MNRLALATLASLLLSTSQVLAQEEQSEAAPRLRLNAGASLGYGADMGNDEVATPYGISIRPHLGITLAEGIYLGAFANLGLGGKGDVSGIDPTTMESVITGEQTLSSTFLGGEFGYDFTGGEHFVFRPTFGIGAAIISSKFCDTADMCKETSATYPSLQFGSRFLVPFGLAYVGLDFGYLMVPNRRAVNPADQAFVGIEFGVMPFIGD